MIIRQANINDIENIMKMYDSCVIGMINIGIDQWDSTYPNKEIILKDIESKTSEGKVQTSITSYTLG